MTSLITHSASTTWAWWEFIKQLKDQGLQAEVRGFSTIERVGATFTASMDNPVVQCTTRKLHAPFLYGEAAWILSGSDRVDGIAPYNKHIARFSDDGLSFFGAYGPKVAAQLPYIIKTLTTDMFSRRAVINIWRESPPETKDYPCTLTLQFLIRPEEGKYYLHCLDSMRSSDVWLGLPYDIFNMSIISMHVVNELNKVLPVKINLGTLALHAGSSHLYSEHFEKADEAVQKREARHLPIFTAATGIEEEFRGLSRADMVDALYILAKEALR
jgi:thymidylate synthase